MKSLKYLSKALVGLAAITLLSSCFMNPGSGNSSSGSSGGTTLSQQPTGTEAADAQLTALENALLALINQERVDNGLPELVRDPGLDEIILWYGTDMVLDFHIGHIDANGRRSEERVRYYSGRNDVRCSEITAWWGNGTAEDHYNAYFNSPGHHSAYMEEGMFNLGPTTHVGVVAFTGTGPMGSQYEGNAGTYSALVFCDDSVDVTIDPFSE